jgi:thioredoxin 1
LHKFSRMQGFLKSLFGIPNYLFEEKFDSGHTNQHERERVVKMGVVQLSDREFKQKVLGSEKVVLLDFWAPWCGPCLAITPILEKISQEYDSKLEICKINIDQNKEVASRYQILSIPSLLFFKGGKAVQQLVGLRSAAEIRKVIDSLC